MTLLTSGFTSGKRKRILFVFIILLLSLGVGLFLGINNQHNQNLTSSQQAIIGRDIGTDSCKNLPSINKINIQSIQPKDAVNVLNYRANCYFEKGDYKNATNTYQQIYAFCPKTPNPASCKFLADDSIKSVNSVMAAAKTQQSNKSSVSKKVVLP